MNDAINREHVKFKEVFKFVAPLSLSFILSYLFTVVDLKMVSGIGANVFSIFGITEGLLFFFPLISFSYRSQFILDLVENKEHLSKISTIVSNYLSFVGILAIGSCLVAFAFSNYLLPIFYNLDSLSIETTQSYLKWIIPAKGVHLLTIVMVMLHISHAHSKTILKVTLLTNVSNIMLNYILIYGINGVLPKMGISGCGASTLFNSILTLIIYLYSFFSKTNYKIFFCLPNKKFLSQIKDFTGIQFLNLLQINLLNFFMIKILSMHSNKLILLSVYTMIFSITQLFTASLNGSFMRAQMVFSGNYNSKKIFIQFLNYGLAIGGVLTLIGTLFHKVISNYFMNNSSAAKYLSSYIMIFGIIWLFDYISSLMKNNLLINKLPQYEFYQDSILNWLIYLPLMIFFSYGAYEIKFFVAILGFKSIAGFLLSLYFSLSKNIKLPETNKKSVAI